MNSDVLLISFILVITVLAAWAVLILVTPHPSNTKNLSRMQSAANLHCDPALLANQKIIDIGLNADGEIFVTLTSPGNNIAIGRYVELIAAQTIANLKAV